MLRTVREAILEAEVAELKRELAYYRGLETSRSKFLSEPIEEMSMLTPLRETFRRAARWNVEKDREHTAIKVTGVAAPGGDRPPFSYGYYVDESVLFDAVDAANILGALHEDVVHGLARFIRKEKN